jgi:hypothetical protein
MPTGTDLKEVPPRPGGFGKAEAGWAVTLLRGVFSGEL